MRSPNIEAYLYHKSTLMKANRLAIYLIVNVAFIYLLFQVMVWILNIPLSGRLLWTPFYIPHLAIVLTMFGLTVVINYLLIKLLKIKGRYTVLFSTIEILLFYVGYWCLFGLQGNFLHL
jgi:hypothetical protein